jgi:lipopolysaccharide export system permease protein
LFLWNDQILPRSNHRLRTLQVAIQRNEPSSPTNDPYKSDREMTGSELRQAARTAREEAARAAADGRPTIEQAARQRAARYEVEIQKKSSIAAACLVFAWVGAPIGLRFRRGGVVLVLGVSFAVFVIYYVSLIGGEELGDRLIISPFFAMWTVNLILGIVGLVALWRIRRLAHVSLKLKRDPFGGDVGGSH